MKLELNQLKIIKTKNYLKNKTLFLFFAGSNKNSIDWVKSEQEIKNINFSYYKLFNKTATKLLLNSIYKNFKPTIVSITFFLKPNFKTSLSKNLISSIEKFVCLALKLNTKIYTLNQIENLNYSFDYNEHKIILHQFCNTNIKSSN